MNEIAIKQHSLVLEARQILQNLKGDELQALTNQDAVKSTSWSDAFFRRRLLDRFGNINDGVIEFHDSNGVYVLGTHSEVNDHDVVRIYVEDARFYRRVLLGGSIGAAESFIDGQWYTDDLTKLIRILIRNMSQINRLDKTWGSLKNFVHLIWHKLRRNTPENSRRNIHEHYDLGNDFYKLFLDPTMNYSSGIFVDSRQSMLQASMQKMQWISEKLQLTSNDHVLEIGTGWGGLACFMAEKFGARVTTTTISEQQYKYACQQVHARGLEDLVTVLLKDYRDLSGQYDKVVSIEMVEAVGRQYVDDYFGKCNDLLKAGGMMLLQGITMSQQNYHQYSKNVDFIRRYVFPGGCLPSVVSIGESVGRATNMRMAHLEDITDHYVTTLRRWHDQFHAKICEVRELGYDQNFIRLWHFYLCYCEAAFAERRVNLVQMVLAKPDCKVDPANDYTGRRIQVDLNNTIPANHERLPLETTNPTQKEMAR